MREGTGAEEERNGTSKAATKSREVLPSFLPSFQGQAVYTRQVYCTAEEEEEEEEEERRKERLLGRIKGYGQILFAPWGSATKMFGSGFEGPRLEGNSASKQRERERETASNDRVRGPRLGPRAPADGFWNMGRPLMGSFRLAGIESPALMDRRHFVHVYWTRAGRETCTTPDF